LKIQWTLIFALAFALLIAVFAVINVSPVQVNYVFGTADIPLILVILGSALLGGFIVGMFGIIIQFKLQRKVRQLEAQLKQPPAEENAAIAAAPAPDSAGGASKSGAVAGTAGAVGMAPLAAVEAGSESGNEAWSESSTGTDADSGTDSSDSGAGGD